MLRFMFYSFPIDKIQSTEVCKIISSHAAVQSLFCIDAMLHTTITIYCKYLKKECVYIVWIANKAYLLDFNKTNTDFNIVSEDD